MKPYRLCRTWLVIFASFFACTEFSASTAAAAGTANTNAAPKSNEAKSTHHSLWKIQGPRAMVYLLGSVHVLKAGNYPLPAPLEAAFTNAAIVAFETDIGAMEQLDTQQKFLSKAMLPEDDSLDKQLSPGLYSRFTNEIVKAGLPATVFDRFKPGMAAMTLVVLELQKLGFEPQYGLDKHFYGRAKKAGKTLASLETVDFQIDLVTDLSKDEGEGLMKTTLEDLHKAKTDCDEMVEAWRTGNAESLDKLLNEASRETPSLFRRLLSDRNQRWAPKIEEWVKGNQNVLVVVGAGHLVGEKGVVSLLRGRGLSVVQE